jgi:hypothetical protein
MNKIGDNTTFTERMLGVPIPIILLLAMCSHR